MARLNFGIAILTLAAPLAISQVNVQGTVKTVGASKVFGQSGVHQYTHIWAFAPPNGTGGANDNANFVNNVMKTQSAIDGVSVLEAWNAIEISVPDSNACIPSDLCQPDPVAPQMYHHYDWTTYDKITGTTTPVYQWLQLSGKKVNLLIAGQASGPTNPITPHYVTSSAWYNLFSPQQQDVINGIKDCAGSFGGTSGPSVTATIVSSTVQVTDTNGCCTTSTTSQLSPIQNQDLVWVSASPAACNSGGTTPPTAELASVSSSTVFTYPLPAGCAAPTNITYIGVSQSWAVPYEYPYKNALKAYWAAVVAHYGPYFKLPAGTGTNYYASLNYFRFGGSVGSEWYPYCTSGTNGGVNVGLKYLTSPYIYVKTPTDATHVGWLDYYKEMGDYLQSLAPPFQIIHSINAAETTPDYDYGTQEAGFAVKWSNRFGVRDGFGSQGLSVKDYLNCNIDCDTLPIPPDPSASNWHPMFKQYNTSGVPLELQPIALSYPDDINCTNGCSVTTYSGDLPTFLYSFATSVGGSDFEIYWRDLSLAYDVNNYCHFPGGPPACSTLGTSITLGGQIPDFTHLLDFFQASGQGNKPACGTNMAQTGSTGDCDYAININKAHGQH